MSFYAFTRKKGVLLINLGTPDSASSWSVRKYLKEFLMDKYVINKSFLSRWFLVNCIIVPFRASKSAAAYKKIWHKDGSPLLLECKKLVSQLAAKVDVPVKLSMRYGNPSIEKAVDEFIKEGITDIYVIPLYPQYTLSTVESAKEKFEEIAEKYENLKYKFLNPFYDDPGYISALAETVNSSPDSKYYLFSFHGIPESHVYMADPTHHQCRIDAICCSGTQKTAHKTCYRHQCLQTAKLTAHRLGLNDEQWSVSFQSRLGKEKWLEPYTQDVLKFLPSKDIKDICLLAPSFTTDCLETLEELGIEGKKTFLNAGGENITIAPCLNSSPAWIEFLADKINKWTKK